MTTPHLDPDLEQLRRRLRAAAPATWGPVERLAGALTGESGQASACADVQAELPAYVEAELRGIPVAQRYPDIARHLLSCEECGALYALMLDRELAAGPAALPAPQPLAVLRQEARFEEMRRFVVAVTEALLKAIRPAALADLADAAQVFFDQVRSLGAAFRLEPAAAHALGQGGDLTPAVRFLMASFLATQRLGEEAPEAQEGTPARAQLSRADVQRAALAAARDGGLRGAEAKRFADAYTDLVMAGEMALPAWPDDD